MPRRIVVDPRFPVRLRELLDERGMSFRALAGRVHYSKSYLHDLAAGRKAPTAALAQRIDRAVQGGGSLAALVSVERETPDDDELEAWELAQRAGASDLGEGTLSRLEEAVDELAMSYATVPPADLLRRVKPHLTYVGRVIDVRKTLRHHRRLLVAGAWLSLLAATMHVDLRQSTAARARLAAAAALASEAEHREIVAWSLETRAWEALTAGSYRAAVDLSRQAQDAAPPGSSALIQATAQEGRAWARMRQSGPTRDALDRVARLTATLGLPDQPEHHYRYDPDKALSYTATTLAWAGDPVAEQYVRALLRQLVDPSTEVARPRRVAVARLDLALALVANGKPDEAAAEATTAISSGRVVPSNWWRATEVLVEVTQSDISEAADLRDAYETYQPSR